MFPVYARGSVVGISPIFFAPEDMAGEMLRNGSAKKISDVNGKAIQLLLNLEQFRGVSAQMGPRVTFLAAGGSRFHQEIAQAYMTAGTHCPLIRKSASA